MPNPRNTLIVAGTVVVIGAAVATHKSMQNEMVKRFSDRDPKLVKKAYNQIFIMGLTGQFNNVDPTNEFLDALFEIKYKKLAEKQ